MRSRPPSSVIASLGLFICLAILGAYIYSKWEQVSPLLTQLDPVTALLVFVTIGCQIAARTRCEQQHYYLLGSQIPMAKLYSLLSTQNILNYLPFKAGTLLTATTLKRDHGVSLSNYTAVYLAQNLLIVAITCLTTAFAVFLVDGISLYAGLILFLIGLSLLILFFIPPLDLQGNTHTLLVLLHRIHTGITICRQDLKGFVLSIGLRLTAVLFMTWRFQILLALTATEVSFPTSLLITSSVLLSMLISIMPAGLGVRELLLAAASTATSISAPAAVIVSVTERIFVLLYSAAVVLVGYAIRRRTQG